MVYFNPIGKSAYTLRKAKISVTTIATQKAQSAILATDLLKGIAIGLLFGIFYTLRHSYRNAYHMKDVITNEDGHEVHHLVLAEEVSFFNKASIIKALDAIPVNSKVIIDCEKSKSIAHDVVEIIMDFKTNAKSRNIIVETVKFIEPSHLKPIKTKS